MFLKESPEQKDQKDLMQLLKTELDMYIERAECQARSMIRILHWILSRQKYVTIKRTRKPAMCLPTNKETEFCLNTDFTGVGRKCPNHSGPKSKLILKVRSCDKTHIIAQQWVYENKEDIQSCAKAQKTCHLCNLLLKLPKDTLTERRSKKRRKAKSLQEKTSNIDSQH